MYLFLDTETTGVTQYDRIVSIGWAIYDAGHETLASNHSVIYPEGFTIPAEATAIHRITTTMAKRQGIPLVDVLAKLHSDIAQHLPGLCVGHNVSFDRPIVLHEYERVRLPENISALPTYCTMKSSCDLCQLPPFRRGSYKWPKLDELHRHLFGQGPAVAHDAAADVAACARCFFKMVDLGLVPRRAAAPAQRRQLLRRP